MTSHHFLATVMAVKKSCAISTRSFLLSLFLTFYLTDQLVAAAVVAAVVAAVAASSKSFNFKVRSSPFTSPAVEVDGTLLVM